MPNVPINVCFWLLLGVTESYRATITEISYLELPSENQSKYAIKPRRVAVTWMFLFCWHPLTSSNSVWVQASPFIALLPQPPETVLSHVAFTAGQRCYSTSDTREKKTTHSYLRIGSLRQPLESSLKLRCSLLPHMKGFWSPVTPALAQPWCTLPGHLSLMPFDLFRKQRPLSYECCVSLGLQRETPGKSQKYYWHRYLEHWYAVTGI